MSVHRDEVEAALEARRELGPAYEDEIVDSLVAKIEQRLDERRPARPPDQPRTVTPLALGSIALGIPVTAVALSNAQGAGGIAVAIIAWIAIALLNIAYAFRR